MNFRKPGYRKRLDKQTLEWAKGNPTHNVVDDECCPDFSCCSPGLLVPPEVRHVFYNAYEKGDANTTNRLLGEFLGKMLAHDVPSCKVHIAGLEQQRREVG